MSLFLELAWQNEAACMNQDTELFFTPDSSAPGAQVENLDTIRRMCAGCPVLSECFEHSVRHEQYGVWAGLTASERARIRKEQNLFVSRPELQLTA
jgi:WhiB family redox-sensing transcriptional regulator